MCQRTESGSARWLDKLRDGEVRGLVARCRVDAPDDDDDDCCFLDWLFPTPSLERQPDIVMV